VCTPGAKVMRRSMNKEGREMVVKKLPYKNRRRLLLLGDHLNGQLWEHVTELH